LLFVLNHRSCSRIFSINPKGKTHQRLITGEPTHAGIASAGVFVFEGLDPFQGSSLSLTFSTFDSTDEHEHEHEDGRKASASASIWKCTASGEVARGLLFIDIDVVN
jgi:hypothetical protein